MSQIIRLYISNFLPLELIDYIYMFIKEAHHPHHPQHDDLFYFM